MAYEMDWSRAFRPPGLAGQTSAPMNADQVEQDLPPGAPAYSGGPLANPMPSPTPGPSLTTLANGGTNHQEAWMAGQPSPTSFPQQQPFASNAEQDLPPGAPGYAGGPLATTPRPTPTPKPDMNLLKRFSWSSSFDQQPAY